MSTATGARHVFFVALLVVLLLIRIPLHPNFQLGSVLSVLSGLHAHDLAGTVTSAHAGRNVDYVQLNPGLVKREAVTLSVENAICKGRSAPVRLRAKDIQLTVFHTVEDLEANGWMDDPVAKEDERYYHARDLDPVLSQLGIPLESGRSFRDAKQAEDFLNMDNVHTEATDGFYLSEFNTEKGTIVALGTESPRKKVETDEDNPADTPRKADARIPKVSRWSDVVWIQWADVCRKANKEPSSLEYIFRYHIVTVNTQFIMEQITDVKLSLGKLQLPWPGRDVYLDTNEGLALLGTPHLTGIVWMLHDHRDVIKKTITKMRMFTIASSYYILVYLE